jgi:hypothetical protein
MPVIGSVVASVPGSPGSRLGTLDTGTSAGPSAERLLHASSLRGPSIWAGPAAISRRDALPEVKRPT